MVARKKAAQARLKMQEAHKKTPAGVQHVAGRKTVRNKTLKCGDCPACRRKSDCLVCSHCLDKPMNGGPNKLKQACKEKACKLRRPLPQGTSDYQKTFFFVCFTNLFLKFIASFVWLGGRWIHITFPSATRWGSPVYCRPSPAEASPIGQIHPFSKMAVTFEPLKGFWCPLGFRKLLTTMT